MCQTRVSMTIENDVLSLFDLVYFKELKTRTEICASYQSPMTTTKERPTELY